ncbi:MAG: hypothetical protein ACXWTT_00945 [Methylobacter sp.]
MSNKKNYTQDQKTEILAYAEEHTDKEAAEMFGVSSNTIGKWKKGGSSKSIQFEKLIKFRDRMLERELQNPETKDKVWEVILQDPTIRGKIGDLILDGAF